MQHRDPESEPHAPRVLHTDVHTILRRGFELAQDAIVAALCVIVLGVMVYSVWVVARLAFVEVRPPLEVLSQIVLVLVEVDLFRSLIYYLREHRVSVSLMLEVAIVSELREVILHPPGAFSTAVFGNAALLLVLGALLFTQSRVTRERQ